MKTDTLNHTLMHSLPSSALQITRESGWSIADSWSVYEWQLKGTLYPRLCNRVSQAGLNTEEVK